MNAFVAAVFGNVDPWIGGFVFSIAGVIRRSLWQSSLQFLECIHSCAVCYKF